MAEQSGIPYGAAVSRKIRTAVPQAPRHRWSSGGPAEDLAKILTLENALPLRRYCNHKGRAFHFSQTQATPADPTSLRNCSPKLTMVPKSSAAPAVAQPPRCPGATKERGSVKDTGRHTQLRRKPVSVQKRSLFLRRARKFSFLHTHRGAWFFAFSSAGPPLLQRSFTNALKPPRFLAISAHDDNLRAPKTWL